MTPSELLRVQQRFERLAPRAEEAGFGRGDMGDGSLAHQSRRHVGRFTAATGIPA